MVAMDFTRAEEESFKASFRARRRWLIGLAVPVTATIFLVLMETTGRSGLGVRLGLADWVLPTVAIGVAVGALALFLTAWRCPVCRHFLGADPAPSFCRRCGCSFD